MYAKFSCTIILFKTQNSSKELILCKTQKCKFYCRKVTFLGHNVDEYGMHINRDKVASVNAWPTPKTTKEVQRKYKVFWSSPIIFDNSSEVLVN